MAMTRVMRVRFWQRGLLRGAPPARERSSPALGIALGGGGARGLAHIGVLKVVEEVGLDVRVVTGTSMGGVIAIAWAAGVSASEIEAVARRVRVLSLLGRDRTGLGVVGTDKVAALVAKVVGKRNLEDLPRRCAVVAADVAAGEPVVIDRGPVERAVQATIAIPGLFSPVREGERLLVDGGIVEPVPVATALALGAQKVIAVDVTPDRSCPLLAAPGTGLVPKPLASSLVLLRLLGRQGLVDVVVKAFDIQAAELARAHLERTKPEVLIRPALSGLRPDQFDEATATIAAGEAAARAAAPELARLCRRRMAPTPSAER